MALPMPMRSARRPPLDEIRPNGKALRVSSGAGIPCPVPEPSRLVDLSPREHEIARLVAKGLVNKTIGSVLDISPWTVATHLRRIFAKLGVTSRASMVATIYANQHPEVRPPGE